MSSGDLPNNPNYSERIFIKFIGQGDNGYVFKNFNRVDLKRIGNLLHKYNSLKSISFYSLRIDESLSEFFFHLQSSTKHLKSVQFFSCQFAANFYFVASFVGNCELEEFYINYQRFNDYCHGKLNLHMLDNSLKSLKKLSIIGYNMQETDCEILAAILSKCSILEYFSLEYTSNIKSRFHLICNGLERSTRYLRYINFTGCGLDSSNIFNLIVLVHLCSSLIFLGLGNFPKYQINAIKEVGKHLRKLKIC